MKTETIDPYTTSPIRHRMFTLAQFPEALQGVKGGLRVRRRSWAKNSYLAMRDPDATISVPYLVLKTAEGPIVPWVPSQSDLLAFDWDTI